MSEFGVTVDLDVLAAVTGEVDPAAVTTVMGDPFARYVLVALRDRDVISFDHLAEIVVGFDAAARGAIAGQGTLERVRIRLYHVSLPKLDTIEFIAFDPDEGTVTDEGIPDVMYEVLGVEV